MRCPSPETSVGGHQGCGGSISYFQEISALLLSMAATEQYLSRVSSSVRFTAISSSVPRNLNTTSIFVHTRGASGARSPEHSTTRDSSFWRFFSRMLTISLAVHPPSASKSISIGLGALFDWLSASMATAWPEGLLPRNCCSPTHRVEAVCMKVPLKGAGFHCSRFESEEKLGFR